VPLDLLLGNLKTTLYFACDALLKNMFLQTSFPTRLLFTCPSTHTTKDPLRCYVMEFYYQRSEILWSTLLRNKKPRLRGVDNAMKIALL